MYFVEEVLDYYLVEVVLDSRLEVRKLKASLKAMLLAIPILFEVVRMPLLALTGFWSVLQSIE